MPFKWLKEMYTKPLPPMIGQVRCTLERKKSGGMMDMFPEMRFVLSLSDERKTIVMAKKEKRSKHKLEYQLQIDQERFKSLAKTELKKMDLDLGSVSSNLNR